MKRIFIILVSFYFISCSNSDSDSGVTTNSVTNSASAEGKQNANLPVIKFTELEFDFGRITQGEKVEHDFLFNNIGQSNLIISGAQGSCGCTIPEYPKEPIKPGETGKIKVMFNSEGKKSYQEKTVTVVTNCEPATRIIRIKADVIVAETAK